jgi:hypothetical protein
MEAEPVFHHPGGLFDAADPGRAGAELLVTTRPNPQSAVRAVPT